MELRVLADSLSVCQLPLDSTWPVPTGSGFFSVTRTNSELSLVCSPHQVPSGPDVRVESGWRALEVIGPLDFSMIGVLASLSGCLADVAVSVFVISTYDTDYILVRGQALVTAVDALVQAGHLVDHA